MRNDYVEDYLMHSKGPWKKHKYIKKVGNTYIYPNGYRDAEGEDNTRNYQSNEYRDIDDGNGGTRRVHASVNVVEVDTSDSTKTTKDYQRERQKAIRNAVKKNGVADTTIKLPTMYFDGKTRRPMLGIEVNARATINKLKVGKHKRLSETGKVIATKILEKSGYAAKKRMNTAKRKGNKEYENMMGEFTSGQKAERKFGRRSRSATKAYNNAARSASRYSNYRSIEERNKEIYKNSLAGKIDSGLSRFRRKKK